MLTICELKERISERMEETFFLEYFSITTEDLVRVFEDKIEENYEELLEEFDDD